MTAALGGYQYESPESRILGQFAADKFSYKDQQKNLIELNNFAGFASGMLRKMQKGVDKANQNYIQQIQTFIRDFIVMLGGGGDTGFDFGDLKYVIQAIGALFGFADEDGNITVPINLFNTAWHFFANYIGVTTNFRELIDQLIDNAIATVLDLFGEVPIAGQALQQLAAFISDIRDLIDPIAQAVQEFLEAFDLDLGNINGIGDFFGPLKPIFDALMDALDGINLPDFTAAFHMIAQWSSPFVQIIVRVINVATAFIKMVTGQGNTQTFAQSIKDISLAVDPTANNGNGLGFNDIGEGLISTVLSGMLGDIDWNQLYQILVPGGTGDALQGLREYFKNFLNGKSPLDASNLFNLGQILGVINIGNLSNQKMEMLDNPEFREAISLQGAGIWSWDETKGRTVPGSAKVTANGSMRQLVSNTIAVAPGDKCHPKVFVQWANLSYSAGSKPIKIQVIPMLYDRTTNQYATMGTSTIYEIANAAVNQNTWLEIGNDYTLPAVCSHMVVQLLVDSTATSGTVWFDDASLQKTGLISMDWVENLRANINAIFDKIKDVAGGIFKALTGNLISDDVITDLQNLIVSPAKVSGSGGLGTLEDTFHETWNQLWGSLARKIGAGKSIAEVANTANQVSTTAGNAQDLSVWNNALLSIRNDKGLMQGMDPTSESEFLISDLFNNSADPTSISATASSQPMAFFNGRQTSKKGSISWWGKGFSNVTGLYIEVYKFNFQTLMVEKIHTSVNLIGQVTNVWSPLRYNLPVDSRFQVNAGEIFAIAWRVTGTGFHQIAAKIAGSWFSNDMGFIPRRPAATRPNSDNSAFSYDSLANWYSGNTPWVALGIVDGDVPPAYYAPRGSAIGKVGAFTYDIPPWANIIECVYVPGAGAGSGGDGNFGAAGRGGYKGAWLTETLVRGVDFPVNATQLTGTIGDGGTANGVGVAGNAGGATTRNAIPGGKAAVTTAGGQGGSGFDYPTAFSQGESMGTIQFGAENIVYTGGNGGAGGRPGMGGSIPGGAGGGGYGGFYTVGFVAGNGARGDAFFRARQV